MRLELPKYLKGEQSLRLKEIFEEMWTKAESNLGKFFTLVLIEQSPDTALNLYLEQAGIEANIAQEYKRKFLENYSYYKENRGKRAGLMLAKEIFELDELEIESMRDSLYSNHYPFFSIRIRMSELDNNKKLEEVKKYMEKTVLARSSKHLHFTCIEHEGNGFGKTPFGETLGK